MTDDRSLGRRIRDERVARELTQEQLADRLGTSRFRVIQWEQDRQLPNPLYAAKISSQLGIPVDLFERETVRAQYDDVLRRLRSLEDQVATAALERRDLAQLVAELTDRVERQEALESTPPRRRTQPG